MSDQPNPAHMASSTDVDALVAYYAPIGRHLRRRRMLARVGLAVLVPLLGTAAFVAWQSRQDIVASLGPTSDARRIEEALAEFRQLKASMSAETGALAAQREALARQQELFVKHNDQLAGQLAAINRQRDTLADQSRELTLQRAALAEAIEQADKQRGALQARAGKQPEIDRQLAEVARQKRLLEQQQRQVMDQGRALAQELGDINQQRAEIERQRKAIADQQAEVRKLLEELNRVSANRLQQKQGPAPRGLDTGSPPVADPDDESDGPMARVAAVDHQVLGDMRGGISLGEDYTIAIGITRTTSLNGIEQFSSAMYLNDLATTVGAGVAQQALDPVIIQNGGGNFIAMDTLGAMSPAVATIIQNTLDNQTIANQTVLDISLQNIATVTQGLQLSQIVNDSLARQP